MRKESFYFNLSRRLKVANLKSIIDFMEKNPELGNDFEAVLMCTTYTSKEDLLKNLKKRNELDYLGRSKDDPYYTGQHMELSRVLNMQYNYLQHFHKYIEIGLMPLFPHDVYEVLYQFNNDFDIEPEKFISLNKKTNAIEFKIPGLYKEE